MERWHFGARRYVPHELYRRMRAECGALVLSNVQPHVVVPFIVGARRLGLPIVAHVASWDHTVGKGVDRAVLRRATSSRTRRCETISPGITRSAPERVVVTGWPQTDIYARRRPREEYERARRALRARSGASARRRHGEHADEHAVRGSRSWSGSSPGGRPRAASGRRSSSVRIRATGSGASASRAALDTEGVAVQEASFTDFEELATLLQHCDCVVANAGTILLDALVNDRPAVCVLYDEGAPPGES